MRFSGMQDISTRLMNFVLNDGSKTRRKKGFPGEMTKDSTRKPWVEMRLVSRHCTFVVAALLTNYDVAFAEGFDPVAFESSWTDAYLLLIEEPFEVTFTPKSG
ncbi:cytochrome P450 67 [Puccinia sorghi]|uniref:Cytochrome P450 67 n=1 Tax=Puccinia sorghi TaxID=27349 RepID=A0A0L6UR78_9BASI|nr:cytochrome P450 67 [Puccinia sorghi]